MSGYQVMTLNLDQYNRNINKIHQVFGGLMEGMNQGAMVLNPGFIAR